VRRPDGRGRSSGSERPAGRDRHDRYERPPAGGERRGGPRPDSRATADDQVRLDLPDSITADQLDPEALAELRTLPSDLASVIARLLVATSIADDPDQAYRYAKKARDLAARVGVVRETCAIAAYQAGDWSTALAELRAARRLTGRASYLPMMADCERALGRLDRALDLVTGPDARAADQATRIELRIVESGIRRDQGLLDAAVVALQGRELTGGRIRPEHARLYYAYADALLEAGREDDAREWFGRAASADVDAETDAAERYEELDDYSFDDLDEPTELDEEPDNDLVADQELDSDLVADQGLDNDLVADQGLDEDL
jgi:tetratricopeptide (TPR) repeat protein